LTRSTENTGFCCVRCGAAVMPLSNGGYRNHCPRCLYSLHVDVRPGDRANRCRSPMSPVAIAYSRKKGFQVVHRCLGCGGESRCRAATDTLQPDRLAPFMRQLACGRPEPFESRREMT
jgi:hypothetical protein